MTGPLPIRPEMNFHMEMERYETSKVVIRRKKVYVDRHMGGLGESHTHGSLNHFFLLRLMRDFNSLKDAGMKDIY